MNIKIASQFKTLLLPLATVVSIAPSIVLAEGPRYPWPGGADVRPSSGVDEIGSQIQPASSETAPENFQPQSAQEDPLLKFLNQMLGTGMRGPGIASSTATDAGVAAAGRGQYPTVAQIRGSGKMESCGKMNGPTQVQSALKEARAFMRKCDLARRGPNQKIAINDYSGGGPTPMMYIFDLDGNCLGRTAVSYGNGAGKTKPQPCSDDGDHLTPAGFHLTSTHAGKKYGPSDAIGLVGLEGQASVKRGVIMHPKKDAGTANTWGCPGVGFDAFGAVKSTLGEGSLVYNFFGQTTGPKSCQNNPGLTGQHNFCRLDSGANPVPSSSTGGGAPSVTDTAQ